MIRVKNWRNQLYDFIEIHRKLPFIWGRNDCCLFACTAVQAMTGIDIASDFRGKYSSGREALAVLQKLGYASVEDVANKKASEYGIEEIPLQFTKFGDVLLQHGPFGSQLGLCINTHIAVPGPEGIEIMMKNSVLKAWRI